MGRETLGRSYKEAQHAGEERVKESMLRKDSFKNAEVVVGELLKSEIQVNSRPLQGYTVCEMLLSGWVSLAWPRVSPPS